MTPKQRRELYGHLTDMRPTLNAVIHLCLNADSSTYLPLLSARGVVMAQIERLEKEMDDDSGV